MMQLFVSVVGVMAIAGIFVTVGYLVYRLISGYTRGPIKPEVQEPPKDTNAPHPPECLCVSCFPDRW